MDLKYKHKGTANTIGAQCYSLLSLSLFVFLSKILINCGLGVGWHRKEEGGHFKFIECRAEAAAVLASTYFPPQYHHKETSLSLDE